MLLYPSHENAAACLHSSIADEHRLVPVHPGDMINVAFCKVISKIDRVARAVGRTEVHLAAKPMATAFLPLLY